MIKKEDFYEKHALQCQIFYGNKCATGKTYQTKCTAGQIF